MQRTARDFSKVRAARAARLFFLTLPIKFLIRGGVAAVLLSMLKLPNDQKNKTTVMMAGMTISITMLMAMLASHACRRYYGTHVSAGKGCNTNSLITSDWEVMALLKHARITLRHCS